MKKIVVIALIALLSIAACSSHHLVVDGFKEYYVGSGETLWEIASSYGNEYDKREIVEIIKNKNNMENANLKAYTTIEIPIFKN